MRRRRLQWIAAALLAAFVASVDTMGWLGWMAVAGTASVNPEAGALALAANPLAALPSFVHRARRLAVRDLGGASRETVVLGLARLGRLQALWMPTDPAGFTHLSHAAILGDRPSEAVARIDRAVALDPLSPSLRRLRALVLLYVGALDRAIEDLVVAYAVAPGLRSPPVELAPEDQGRVRRWGLELRGSLYPRRRVQTALELARSLRADGERDRAAAVLEPLRGHPEIVIQRAAWALEAGESRSALASLEALAQDRRIPRALRARSWSLIAVARDGLGDSDGALEAARAAIALERTSPAPYVTLSALALRRGDHEEALDHLRRAWGMAPADVGLLHRIAAVALQAGRQADGLLALERAVEIEPDEPRHVAALASVQLETGRFAEAAVTLSRGLDRFPADPELLRLAERLRREVDRR